MMIGMTGFGTHAVAAVPSGPGYAGNGSPAADSRPGAPCEPRMRHLRRDTGFRMNDRLNLNAEQRAGFRELRMKFFDQAVTGRRHLMQLRRELAEESVRKAPDQKKINVLTEKIGREHAVLAGTESRFFNELSRILTPEQLQTFLNMKEHRFHGA
jgi:Spy/CpxP family protein refolding chaperone